MSTVTAPALGTHSEIGTLHTVLVHRPHLDNQRLSSTSCPGLLFVDVIWVRLAWEGFDAFVGLMRERYIEVILFPDLRAETLADDDARSWLLSRRLRPE